MRISTRRPSPSLLHFTHWLPSSLTPLQEGAPQWRVSLTKAGRSQAQPSKPSDVPLVRPSLEHVPFFHRPPLSHSQSYNVLVLTVIKDHDDTLARHRGNLCNLKFRLLF